jgi:hypothetical protein
MHRMTRCRYVFTLTRPPPVCNFRNFVRNENGRQLSLAARFCGAEAPAVLVAFFHSALLSSIPKQDNRHVRTKAYAHCA